MTDKNVAEVEQLCHSQDNKLTTASVKPHVSLACHGDLYSECWRGTASIGSREYKHQQWMSCDCQSRSTSARFSVTSCLDILLQSEHQSILLIETRDNNHQIVLCENHFQSNLQMRYLHSSIFNSTCVIKCHLVASFSNVINDVSEIYN